MSGAANNPNLERVRLLSSEITSIEIYSDQTNDKYYVGEDVTITAKFNKPFKVLCVKWQFNGNSLRNTIDTELPKYAGTRYENNKHLLVIKNCCALDAGEYFLVATCKQEEDIYSKDVGICRDSVDICSNKLHLKVGQGSPQVTLNEEHSAVFNKCAKITAAIRSYPKHNSVKWKKGEDPIDITLPKYAGSSVDGDSPVLCINNVEEEDGADYTIEVQNEMGKAIGSRTVQVLGDCPKVTLNEEHSAVFNKCAKITAAITSFPKHNSVIWKKGEDQIDITLPKYAGSSVDGDSPVLCITDVEEKDSDDYTIEVQNEMGKAICSRKIEVIGAPPEVTLNDGIAAVFHKYTEIIATIRSFPKHSSVIWKKGEDIIDITLPKYAGSSFDGNHLILYIANVEKEDEDVYTIEVQNEKGIATCSKKVVVLGGK